MAAAHRTTRRRAQYDHRNHLSTNSSSEAISFDHAGKGVSLEAEENLIEKATGDAPTQGFFESDAHYRERLSLEADEHRASSEDGSTGGCFLTTACVEFAQLPDDCRELTLLRHLRDTYVAQLPDGGNLLTEYYQTAPRIVAAISSSSQKTSVLREVWAKIQEAVAAIERGDYSLALTIYKGMFLKLCQDLLA